MGKRVAVVLSGCGAGDGSEIREAVLTLLSLERAGADVIFAAPDLEQPVVSDHLRGAIDVGAPARRVLSESARIARGQIRALADLQVGDFDALIFPGGDGVGTVLSNYTTSAATTATCSPMSRGCSRARWPRTGRSVSSA
jgi:enhancing lycopene biosynthesis protein 2